MKKRLLIDGMTCKHCVSHVEKALLGVPGIKNATASLETNNATIEGDAIDEEAVKQAILDAGYTVKSIVDPW